MGIVRSALALVFTALFLTIVGCQDGDHAPGSGEGAAAPAATPEIH